MILFSWCLGFVSASVFCPHRKQSARQRSYASSAARKSPNPRIGLSKWRWDKAHFGEESPTLPGAHLLTSGSKVGQTAQAELKHRRIALRNVE